MQNKTLQELADLVGGQVIGNGRLEVTGISSVDAAQEGEITFVAQSKYIPQAQATRASAIIAPHTIEGINKPFIVTDNPYLAYAKIATSFYPMPSGPRGVAEGSIVGEQTRIGKDVSIYPLAFIGNNVTIGDRVVIYPHAFIGDETVVDQDTVIYSHVSIREHCRIG